jgi:hypothetical protein
VSPPQEISHLSKRWRAERNLWMCAFAFSAWVFLAALYREAARRLDLEARLADMERSGGWRQAGGSACQHERALSETLAA